MAQACRASSAFWRWVPEAQCVQVGPPSSHLPQAVRSTQPSSPSLVDTKNMVMGPEWNGMSWGKSPRCASRIPGGSARSSFLLLLDA
eukprot:4453760-Lingulodinium_polyedra.AAC.1